MNTGTNTWQLVPAQADLTTNTFTASVAQLGTYTLGYDSTAPTVSITSPETGATVARASSPITALVADDGIGVDPATIVVAVDGQAIPAQFNIGTGELSCLTPNSLTNGNHTISITAADGTGNTASASSTFRLTNGYLILLPVVSR